MPARGAKVRFFEWRGCLGGHERSRGVIAALAAKNERLPHEAEWSEGIALLAKMGQRV